jgi:hypothetical protein
MLIFLGKEVAHYRPLHIDEHMPDYEFVTMESTVSRRLFLFKIMKI